jgi:uncharacterized protein YaaQ
MGKYSKDHIEYYNKKGEEVPSVTTIIQLINKPSLQKWANVLGFRHQRLEDVLDKKASMGTLLHDALNRYVNGDVYSPLFKYEDENKLLKVYLNSYLGWAKKNKIKKIYTEYSLVSDKFAGTLDFYGKINDKYTILDYKTSKKPYTTHFLQLGAYTYMMEEKGEKVEQVTILIVNEKCEEHTKTREEIQPYIDAFILLVDLYNKWFEINKGVI